VNAHFVNLSQNFEVFFNFIQIVKFVCYFLCWENVLKVISTWTL